MTDTSIKLPRLYVEAELGPDRPLPLTADQHHYLRNVLRREAGASVRLFNGRDGEWRAELVMLDKKSAVARPVEQIRPQPEGQPAIHLLFAPIKKARLEWLVEKAVELGVTHFNPVITQYTENRNLNHDRLQMQIAEAAEQCERLAMPALLPERTLRTLLNDWPQDLPVLACLERRPGTPLISHKIEKSRPTAILIGPEGGFSDDEAGQLSQHPLIIPVSLGDNILRSETAACLALAAVMIARAA